MFFIHSNFMHMPVYARAQVGHKLEDLFEGMRVGGHISATFKVSEDGRRHLRGRGDALFCAIQARDAMLHTSSAQPLCGSEPSRGTSDMCTRTGCYDMLQD